MSEYTRLIALRDARLKTFLEGHAYPTEYPFDPTRELWCTLIGARDPESKVRPREYISIVPTDVSFPVMASDAERLEFIGRFPTLLIPEEYDFIRLMEVDDRPGPTFPSEPSEDAP